jgi:hypothetical protein
MLRKGRLSIGQHLFPFVFKPVLSVAVFERVRQEFNRCISEACEWFT